MMVCNRIQTPNTNAVAASSAPNRLASRSGAMVKEVSPSIEKPISDHTFQVVVPCARRAGS